MCQKPMTCALPSFHLIEHFPGRGPMSSVFVAIPCGANHLVGIGGGSEARK